MSNLVKSFLISNGQEKRVIDYNELINKKISTAKPFGSDLSAMDIGNGDGFVAGLEADVVEVMDEPEEVRLTDEEQIEAAHLSADEILKEAKNEAERILNEAKAEADAMWNHTYASAKKEGFDTGMKESGFELEKMRNELQKEKRKQQEEYTDLLNTMESDLVSVILKVFSKVTKVLSEDKKDIILHLIDNELEHRESSKEFIIRVSKEDYQFVEENKEFLLDKILQNSSLEIVKDATLKKNQCLIETDGGVFDCGLDTQLENLIDDIRSLSCM